MGDELSAVDAALLDYLDDVGDYVERLRDEASRALTRAVRQAADRGWSQRRIAAAVGRSQPEVARLLRATRTPPVEYAFVMPTSNEVEPVPEPQNEDPTPAERRSSTLTWVLRDKRDEIVAIAERHGAHNVRVFGSVARGEDDADSDIDFLVDADAGSSAYDPTRIIVELERMLERPVDLVEADSLWPRVARKALPEAVPL